MPRKKTRNALELIARDVGDEPGFRARTDTTQPVIARLEQADYEGHSLPMLRIAKALNRHLELRLVAD